MRFLKFFSLFFVLLFLLNFTPFHITYGLGVEIPTTTGLPDPTTGAADKDPVTIVLISFLKWLLRIFLILAVIAFVVTGIQYITSMGNPQQAETAKKNLIYTTIAVIVVGSSLAIINTINTLLSTP